MIAIYYKIKSTFPLHIAFNVSKIPDWKSTASSTSSRYEILWRVHGVPLSDIVHICEIPKALNVQLFLTVERFHPRLSLEEKWV